MSNVFNVESLDWKLVRPDMANGVYGKTLLADGIRIILTRVAPGGSFKMHRDDYGHLFYFTDGEGLLMVQNKKFKAVPGLIVRVNNGETHAYENTGKQDLILISVNIPTN